MRVGVAFTTRPAGMEYLHPAWWGFTVGRFPDVELAGPCKTREELLAELKARGMRPGQFVKA